MMFTKKGYAITVDGVITAVYKDYSTAYGVLPVAEMIHFLHRVKIKPVRIRLWERYGTRRGSI